MAKIADHGGTTTSETKKPTTSATKKKKKKLTKKERYRRHFESALYIEREVVSIQKSRIASAGGGAFVTKDVKRGTCLGFYKGRRLTAAQRESSHWWFESGEPGGRDASDPNGRLVTDAGEFDVSGWTPQQWLHVRGKWRGEHSNWVRFVNHASGPHRNCSIAATSQKFGKSHALYANRDINAGDELFFSYGPAFWRSIGIQPEEPQSS